MSEDFTLVNLTFLTYMIVTYISTNIFIDVCEHFDRMEFGGKHSLKFKTYKDISYGRIKKLRNIFLIIILLLYGTIVECL